MTPPLTEFEREINRKAFERVSELAPYLSEEQIAKLIAENRSETFQSVLIGARAALESALVREMAEDLSMLIKTGVIDGSPALAAYKRELGETEGES